MLYLAEVLKKTGFMGAKTELKLLARQQSEQNWTALSGDELISTDAANEYSTGVLVLVELGPNNQIQGIQDATRQLIGILKSFSKMKAKFSSQEEEIEGWKQSLIFQSQELTRREVDMESRAEELEQWQAESEKIAHQRQEFEETRTQILELKDQIESDRQQLEEGWGKLQQAQREYERLQFSQSSSLSDEQVQQIESLLGQLEFSTGQGNLSQLSDLEPRLSQAWATFEASKRELQQRETDVAQREAMLVALRQDLTDAQSALSNQMGTLGQVQVELELQQSRRSLLQEQKDFHSSILDNLKKVQETLLGGKSVNILRLWEMQIPELEGLVQKLSLELDKLNTFVRDQEEELGYQQEAVAEMREKMIHASEYDRLTMQSDVDEEEQHYQLLNETLKGQRQTLRDRESILETHQQILAQRQSSQGKTQPNIVDLTPSMESLSGRVSAAQVEISEMDLKLEGLSDKHASNQAAYEQLETSCKTLSAQIQTESSALAQEKLALGLCRGRLDVYQEILQPIQDVVDSLKRLGGSNGQGQVVSELKQVLMSLGEVPEVMSL